MHQKTASAQEAQQVINLERIVLVYELMMKSALEQNGCWSHDGGRVSPQDNLDILSVRIGVGLGEAKGFEVALF